MNETKNKERLIFYKNNYINLKTKYQFVKNDDCIVYLYKLKNGNLLTCSQDKEINIYSKNNYSLLLSWSGHYNSINSVCELNNSNIVSCSDDKKISIWSYNIDKKEVTKLISFTAHDSYINKIITLQSGNFASCSDDTNIFIWNSKPPYNKLYKLDKHNGIVTSIIQIKDKRIISIQTKKENGNLRVWNLNNNIITSNIINNVHCYSINSLVEINNNIVGIGGYKIIKIVNVDSLQIITTIHIFDGLISSLYFDKNQRTLIAGSEDGELAFISEIIFITKKFIKNAHDMIIYSIIKLQDNIICSSSKDGLIKIWEY